MAKVQNVSTTNKCTKRRKRSLMRISPTRRELCRIDLVASVRKENLQKIHSKVGQPTFELKVA